MKKVFYYLWKMFIDIKIKLNMISIDGGYFKTFLVKIT